MNGAIQEVTVSNTGHPFFMEYNITSKTYPQYKMTKNWKPCTNLIRMWKGFYKDKKITSNNREYTSQKITKKRKKEGYWTLKLLPNQVLQDKIKNYEY